MLCQIVDVATTARFNPASVMVLRCATNQRVGRTGGSVIQFALRELSSAAVSAAVLGRPARSGRQDAVRAAGKMPALRSSQRFALYDHPRGF